MQKNKNIRLESKELVSDILVTILCLIGLYFSLYFFNQAINQSFDKLNETPIGTISFKHKSAQRKLLDRVLWDRLKQESPVYNGDIIRTAELSEATINFVDGNVMNLYEQTLAQVFLDIGGAAVDFTEGGISLDTSVATNGMKLISGNAAVQVDAGSSLNAVAAIATGGGIAVPLSLQMNKGSASLVTDKDSSDGELFTITEGNTVLLSDGGETVVTPSITVLSPSANAKFLKQTGKKLPVAFNWTTENLGVDDYITLETSRTGDFSELTEQINFTHVNEISLDIPAGSWYWRIYPESDKNQSVNGKLQVLDAPLPEAIVPTTDYEYRYRNKTPAVRFMWTEDNYATSWQLEVSNNAAMNNPVINQRSTQPSSIISSLYGGTWYWRVTPLYSGGIITQNTGAQASSVINLFTITQSGELKPLKLMIPAENSFVDTTDAEKDLYFSWQHDYEAESYNITISKEANLSLPLIEQKVTDNYFAISSETAALETGQWYWAVTQTDYEGNQSPQSEIRSFLAVDGEIVQRTIFPPDGYTLAENLVSDTRFTWKTNLPYAMRFQIASDIYFRNISIERTLTTASISGLNLPVGTWYWRIVADTEENGEKTLVYYTPRKTIISAPYLDAVTMYAPAANSRLVVSLNTPIEYMWDTVKDAQYYQIKLYHNSDLSTPVYENLTVEGESIFIDMENMEEGKYIWTMTAMASETAFTTRRGGITSEQTLTIRKLKPITLESPADGIEIEGLDAIFNPPRVRWSSVEKPINAKLILTKHNVGLSVDSHNRGVSPVARDIYFSLENPPTTVQLPKLSSGTWYWTVTAETEDNLNITALEPATFIITPIPPLAVPGNLSPKSKIIFGTDYLVKQRYVDFSWDEVEGADEYILLIKNAANKTVLEEHIENGTSYRLENLAILDKGSFFWTLEAVARLGSDNIIQRGEIAEYLFSIDLPQLKAPRGKNTGELYGL